jgi:hypothetical protein
MVAAPIRLRSEDWFKPETPGGRPNQELHLTAAASRLYTVLRLTTRRGR